MPNPTLTPARGEVILRVPIEDAHRIVDSLNADQHRALSSYVTLAIEQTIARDADSLDIELFVSSRERVTDTILPPHLVDPWANGPSVRQGRNVNGRADALRRAFDPTDQDPT